MKSDLILIGDSVKYNNPKSINNAIKQDTIRLILLLFQCAIAIPLFFYSKENEIISNSKETREII